MNKFCEVYDPPGPHTTLFCYSFMLDGCTDTIFENIGHQLLVANWVNFDFE